MAERLIEEKRIIKGIDLGNLQDPVAVFVKGLEESLERLQEPLSWRLSHNKKRSVRGMAVARDQREHQLLTTKDALKAMKDNKSEEATFYKNSDGRVVGFRI